MVTVTVALMTPSAATERGLEVTVDFDGLGPTPKFTTSAWVRVTLSVTSNAVYATDSATLSVTVNVTRPSAPDGPLAGEITDELPPPLTPCFNVTTLPATGSPPSSTSVTVIVDVVMPSFGTEPGPADTNESESDTDASANVTIGF